MFFWESTLRELGGYHFVEARWEFCSVELVSFNFGDALCSAALLIEATASEYTFQYFLASSNSKSRT